ncbi:MAG: c-type cytochrome [Acidobacteria bacterium]|nr:c-type cytochrome [Acidobacteriota bacterium]
MNSEGRWLAAGLFLALAAAAPVAAAEDKPAEQTQKNIQVLKGMPTSQIGPVMNAMRASLGVNCAFCHVVNGDKWEMDKDDKDEKKTARKMIQMVLDINRNSFGGRPAVTCNSCHRGANHPVGLIPLPAPAPAKSDEGDADEKEPAYPSAQEVVDKYVKAIGGADAAARLKTLSMKGTREGQSGKPAPLEVILAEGNRILIVGTTPNGTNTTASNGKTGWVKNPRGQHEMDADELAQFREAVKVYDPIKIATAGASMKVVATEKIAEKDAYVMRGEGPNGTRLRFYFDRQTGLLLRSFSATISLIGAIPEQTDFDDYREVAGVKIPFTIVYSNVDPWQSATRKFTEVKPNAPIDAARFDPPGAGK